VQERTFWRQRSEILGYVELATDGIHSSLAKQSGFLDGESSMTRTLESTQYRTNIEHRTSNIQHRIPDVHRTSDIEHPTSNTGRTSDIGHRTSNVEYGTNVPTSNAPCSRPIRFEQHSSAASALDVRCRMFDVRLWLGRWMFDVGCSMFDRGFSVWACRHFGAISRTNAFVRA